MAEHEKPSELELGRRLEVFEETYDDLDEILERCLSSLASLARRMTRSPKFLGATGTKAHAKDRLKEEREQNPSRIPYALGHSRERPGTFVFYYYWRKLEEVPVSLRPQGYRVGGQIIGAHPRQVIAHLKKAILQRRRRT